MRSLLHGIALGTAFLVLSAGSMPGKAQATRQTIDRMMAIVDGTVITYGDLLRYRRLADAFSFAGEIPEEDGAALEVLIDEHLIDAQVRQFPVIRVTEEAVRDSISEIQIDAADDPLLTPELIAETARKRLERAQYFDIRFRQFVTASDEEVQDYYETVFVPEARERGLRPVPSLEDVAGQIRENVRTEQTADDIMTWLGSLRRRSDIEVVE